MLLVSGVTRERPPEGASRQFWLDVGVGVDTTPLVEWAQDSSKLNKTAALWSAVAAVCAGLSWGLGLLAHP
jgi:hypothetical protein